jgi:homoserine dehydrogenase
MEGVNERVRIGLVGLGTVGASFYRLVARNAEDLRRRLGAAVDVAMVGVRDASRPRELLPTTRLVEGWKPIVEDPGISIVVELAGGIEAPLALMRAALRRGKHVITANKALLALHGKELFALAAEHGVRLAFEASVCGGIPIVKVLRESLLGNRVARVMGIVNGTTNYILTRMTEDALPYADALHLAQEKGFAEADPAMDVDGEDAAQKISLLASIAFGCWVDWRLLHREGVTAITPKDIDFARSIGFLFKLVAQASMSSAGPMACVYPALVPQDHPLAGIRDEFNAVLLDSDLLGPSVFAGRGAGGDPTASSVASDLGDLVRGILSRGAPGRETAAPVFTTMDPVPFQAHSVRRYFHLVTANRPGIWALVTGTLADHGINIVSVHQKWEDRSKPSDLYVLTDEAEEVRAEEAMRRILDSPGIHPQSRYFRILPAVKEPAP